MRYTKSQGWVGGFLIRWTRLNPDVRHAYIHIHIDRGTPATLEGNGRGWERETLIHHLLIADTIDSRIFRQHVHVASWAAL